MTSSAALDDTVPEEHRAAPEEHEAVREEGEAVPEQEEAVMITLSQASDLSSEGTGPAEQPGLANLIGAAGPCFGTIFSFPSFPRRGTYL